MLSNTFEDLFKALNFDKPFEWFEYPFRQLQCSSFQTVFGRRWGNSTLDSPCYPINCYFFVVGNGILGHDSSTSLLNEATFL